jgi:dCTP deaminase
VILPAQHIRNRIGMVDPFVERGVFEGMSYGLSSAGYDIRIAQEVRLCPGQFKLASTLERFQIPDDILAILHDKSSWARRGIALQNTVFEAGWNGYATLEISDHRHEGEEIVIPAGAPIAQLVFHQLIAPTEQPYRGKYQDQEAGPQEARSEQS